MEAAQIYNVFQENQFINTILSQGNLLLIGEQESINYFKDYSLKLQLQKKNYAHVWQDNSQSNFLTKLKNLSQCEGIIIVSSDNESKIFHEITSLVAREDLHIPVLKLFEDIFVNFMAQTNLIQSSEFNLRKPTVSYGILTLPRSGSTFLCQLLTGTQVAGYPTEHLRKPAFTLAKHCNFDYVKLLHNLMTHRVSLNGVFGTKFISHFLQDFETLGNGLENILTSFDKYIYLIRKDEIAQAISILLAQKTQVWHINNKNKMLNYQDELESIIIDDKLLDEVTNKLYFIRQQQKYIDKILKTYQISPLTIKYEDLVEDVEGNIKQILDYLEINSLPESIGNLKYNIKKMGSEVSLKIAEAYCKKHTIKC